MNKTRNGRTRESNLSCIYFFNRWRNRVRNFSRENHPVISVPRNNAGFRLSRFTSQRTTRHREDLPRSTAFLDRFPRKLFNEGDLVDERWISRSFRARKVANARSRKGCESARSRLGAAVRGHGA